MKEVDSKLTKRAQAFELWMQAPMPMVTLFKTYDVSNLRKFSKKSGYKFNMLLCWCIGKAASQVEEFFMLPVGDKLIAYDKLAVNVVIAAHNDAIYTCDVPFIDKIEEFCKVYDELTGRVYKNAEEYSLGDDYMVIGTSAIVETELDGAVNIYAGFYNNPFVIWGKYRKGFFKTTLPISFQFHHTQMDGGHAAHFLELLQKEIKNL